MEPETGFIGFIKRRWILLVIGIVLLGLLWMVSQYGFVSIEITSGATSLGPITYQLHNQANASISSFSTQATRVTRLVPKGAYELVISQNNTNSFVMVATEGFLQKTTVAARLQPQIGFQFVGYNPEGCMYYLAGTLHSYGCTGATTQTIHVAASANAPTYNLSNSDGLFGAIQNVIDTSEGKLALFQPYGGTSGPYRIYVLKPNQAASDGVALPDLNTSKNYLLAPYKDGFIAYSTDFTDIKYYATHTARPEAVAPSRPAAGNQKPLVLSTTQNAIVAVYSDKADFEERSDPSAVGKVTEEVIVSSAGATEHLTLHKQYKSVNLCDTDTLCAVDVVSKNMDVYDISGSPKLLYAVSGVKSATPFGKNLLLVRDDGIISFDAASRSGATMYRFNNYTYCGLQVEANDFLVCVTDPQQRNAVLRFETDTTNRDNIDQKIVQLEKVTEVKTVSVYGKYIYISANLGDTAYNPVTNTYDYDPDVRRSVSATINQAIDRIGIDRHTYTIIDTADE